MITSDIIKAKVDTLNDINSMLDTTIKDVESMFSQGTIDIQEYTTLVAAYKSVQDYIAQSKQNYKDFVKAANEGKIQ